VRALGGSQEQLLNYLASEVLQDLPREIIDFLRLAAIPHSFDLELLSEVLQSEDVNYLLQRARVLGLPILPMDEQGMRMRFHPLWRELLLRSVYESTDDVGIRVLQRRFGQVFEARGDLEAAIEHYAAARATNDLARALRERAWPLLGSPRRDMVRRWLEQLPAQLREQEPDLLHMWGVSVIISDPSMAEVALRRAVVLYREAVQYDRELRGLGDLAALIFWQSRPRDLTSLGREIIHAAQRVGDPWSTGAARVCVATMLYVQSRELAALRVARQAANLPLNPTWRWMLSMIVATIGARLGRPVESIAAVDDALQNAAIDHDDRLRQNLLRVRAMAMYEQGYIAEGIALSLEAHRHLGDYEQTGMAAHSAFQLALLLTVQGRLDEATTYLAQARTSFSTMADADALANVQIIEIYCTILRGQKLSPAELASVQRPFQEATSKAPDLRIWLLLALAFGEIGDDRRALQVASDLTRTMEARGYRLFLASAYLYVAYLAGRVNDVAMRETALRQGWGIIAADEARFLPILPAHVVQNVAVAALKMGFERESVGRVLRRQIPDKAITILQELLSDQNALVRANAARLLGDLGAVSAYTALRGLLKDRDTTVRQAVEHALSRLVYRPPYTLRVRTLGNFALWRGDQEVRDRDWRSSKARQLFQILVTERGRVLPREWILETLWPDMDADAAANNLRVTINRMSKAIEPDRPDGAPSSYIIQQADTYSFNLNADHELDATQFVIAVEEGREADQAGQRSAAVAAYRRAMGLYGGAYLPDNMYEDWTVVERERLVTLFNEAAVRLGALLLEEGLAHEAIGLAWRVLENDQAQEDAYRLLMRAHAYLGERSTALRLYARCMEVLKNELGVEPMPETAALAQSLREVGDTRG
jgi:DNA-binding SARP family transcriptional activator/ATP/maltotriose-dependent transcriptional regulator MalT